MPYIKPEDRLPATLNGPKNVGELNFLITRMVDLYLGSRPNYAAYNEAIGVLECAKLELYRRLVAPYEDRKIAENGDAYSMRMYLTNLPEDA